MEPDRFLDGVAARLGRSRLKVAPARPTLAAPWPAVEGSLSDRFTIELERVGGQVTHVRSREALLAVIEQAILEAGAAPTIALSRSEFEYLGLDTKVAPWGAVSFWGDPSCSTPDRFRLLALKADLGITTVLTAVASTGTLVLSAAPSRPRSVSLVPRRHLAILRRSQIVPDLGIALGPAARDAEPMPSALFCITGPSRTSDIENDLSIGVHGPEKVHVVLWDESAT